MMRIIKYSFLCNPVFKSSLYTYHPVLQVKINQQFIFCFSINLYALNFPVIFFKGECFIKPFSFQAGIFCSFRIWKTQVIQIFFQFFLSIYICFQCSSLCRYKQLFIYDFANQTVRISIFITCSCCDCNCQFFLWINHDHISESSINAEGMISSDPILISVSTDWIFFFGSINLFSGCFFKIFFRNKCFSVPFSHIGK